MSEIRTNTAAPPSLRRTPEKRPGAPEREIAEARDEERKTAYSESPSTRGRQPSPEQNLAVTHPELLPEWDDPLDPETVLPSSHVPIRWRCPAGHSYRAMPYSRIGGSGCPYCTNRRVLTGFNDLQTLCPQVAAEWADDLNELTPDRVTRGCTKRVWWRCSFGHEWRAAVYSRTREKAAGCPFCKGRYRQKRRTG